MTQLAAVILAAGLSSRMGAFKPLLPLGAGTVLSRCIELFRQNGIGRIVVVTGKRSEEVASAARRAGAIPVHNSCFEQGMFSSVLTGVGSLGAGFSGFFMLPVDIPLVRPQTVTRLVHAFEENRATIIYPRFQGKRGHPPIISRELVPDILAHDGQGGLRALLDTHESVAWDLDVADAGVLKDLDHPMDYDFAKLRVGTDYPFPEEWEQLWDIYSLSREIREHCRAVASVGAAICDRLNAVRPYEKRLNPALVIGAAMVHDIAKGRKQHDAVGDLWLKEHGFRAAARIVREHSDLLLEAQDPVTEKEIVFLADKLVQGTSFVPLNTRYEVKLARFGETDVVRRAIRARQERANEVLRRIESESGVGLEQLAGELFG